MTQMIVCSGNLVQAKAGPTNVINVLACDSGWQIVPYDPDAISFQLASLTTFDPVLASQTIGFSMLIFTIGFIAGVIIRNLRRA